MTSRRRWILPAVMGVLALLALVFAIVATRESDKRGGSPGTSSTEVPLTRGGFAGAEIPVPKPAPPIALRDQYGQPVSLAALRGKPVVIAFLYTHCGAPCTLIAQQIRGALDELKEPVTVLIVSADPAGDTPQAVRSFLAATSLSGRVHYLTGSPAALGGIWRTYRVKPASAGARAFAEHAAVLLVDPNGRERVLYGTEQLTPEALAHDISRFM
jgi:protein SCO1/2